MKKNKIHLPVIFSAIFFQILCSSVSAHPPGVNPVSNDESPGGSTPGSALTRGEWETKSAAELQRIEWFIQDLEAEKKQIEDKNKELIVSFNRNIEHLNKVTIPEVENKIKEAQAYKENLIEKKRLLEGALTKKRQGDVDTAKELLMNNPEYKKVLFNYAFEVSTETDLLTASEVLPSLISIEIDQADFDLEQLRMELDFARRQVKYEEDLLSKNFSSENLKIYEDYLKSYQNRKDQFEQAKESYMNMLQIRPKP